MRVCAMGNYKKFVDEFLNGHLDDKFYNPKTMKFITLKEKMEKLINNNKIVYFKGELYGNEESIKPYKNYIDEREKDCKIVKHLKNASSAGKVNFTLNRINNSLTLNKEKLINELKLEFINEKEIFSYINEKQCV